MGKQYLSGKVAKLDRKNNTMDIKLDQPYRYQNNGEAFDYTGVVRLINTDKPEVQRLYSLGGNKVGATIQVRREAVELTAQRALAHYKAKHAPVVSPSDNVLISDAELDKLVAEAELPEATGSFNFDPDNLMKD